MIETCPRCGGNPNADERDAEHLAVLLSCGVMPMTLDTHRLCCGTKRNRRVLSRNAMRRRNIGGKRGRNSGKVSQHGKKS